MFDTQVPPAPGAPAPARALRAQHHNPSNIVCDIRTYSWYKTIDLGFENPI